MLLPGSIMPKRKPGNAPTKDVRRSGRPRKKSQILREAEQTESDSDHGDLNETVSQTRDPPSIGRDNREDGLGSQGTSAHTSETLSIGQETQKGSSSSGSQQVDLSVGQEKEPADPNQDMKKLIANMLQATLPQVVKEAVRAATENNAPKNTTTQTQNTTSLAAAVAQQTQQMTGESIHKDTNLPTANLPSLPLDLHLTSETRARIISNGYINFAQLLNKTSSEPLAIQIQNTQAQQHIVLAPQPHKQHITSIDAWNRAFDIYCYAYFAKNHQQAQSVIKYGRLIRDMAWKGFHWAKYDDNFRRLRETNPDAYPWDRIEPQLWAECTSMRMLPTRPTWTSYGTENQHSGPSRLAGMQFKQSQQSTPFRGPRQQKGSPKSVCFRYNRGEPCFTNCKFQHVCLKCGGPHTGQVCRSA